MTALLFAALAAATAAADAVGKRATMSMGSTRYKYASSEDVITEAREALSACGLAMLCTDASLIPLAQTADGDGVLATQWQAHCIYLLVHSSGESIQVESRTPVMPGAGRPLDKAMATAKTYDLAYTLRSLLLLPRVDPREIAEEPVDQRRDVNPPAGGSDAEALVAGFAAATTGEAFDAMMRRASVFVRDLHDKHPDRVACRDAATAAKARIGGAK